MPPKNRTKRTHATERRERRAAFFSASKTTRGEWGENATHTPRNKEGNRHTRRDDDRRERLERRAFGQGKWVRTLAFAVRGFARRTLCVIVP